MFHKFWNFNNTDNIVYFDVLNHCMKNFHENNVDFFPLTFWSRTQIWNIVSKNLWIYFFPKVILKSFYFKLFYQAINWVSTI
jgi:hypothetical protein